MGFAAYQRGSLALSRDLDLKFKESRSYKKSHLEQWQRAESQIERLEQFCLDAQALFIDSIDQDTSKGFLKSAIFERHQKKQHTKIFAKMLDEANKAHAAWVDSDRVNTFVHITYCYRKARAWNTIINYLNDGFVLPFKTPSYL
jgi:hypothetical protein